MTMVQTHETYIASTNQQCEKCLHISKVLKPFVSPVNNIRSHALNDRVFHELIEKIGENYLSYYTAVDWFSCGKVVKRFPELWEKNRILFELQKSST